MNVQYVTIVTYWTFKLIRGIDSQKYENLKVVKMLPLTQDVLDGKELPECLEGQHERDIGDAWDYKGLYILESRAYSYPQVINTCGFLFGGQFLK